MLQNKQLVDYPSDLNVIYSVVMLLSYSVDVDNSEEVDRVIEQNRLFHLFLLRTIVQDRCKTWSSKYASITQVSLHGQFSIGDYLIDMFNI